MQLVGTCSAGSTRSMPAVPSGDTRWSLREVGVAEDGNDGIRYCAARRLAGIATIELTGSPSPE